MDGQDGTAPPHTRATTEPSSGEFLADGAGAAPSDAFLSYRRGDGSAFTRWLYRRLMGFRPPPALLGKGARPLRIFQDTEYDRASPDYWAAKVLPHLRATRFLVVIVTPSISLERPDGSPNGVMEEIEAFLGQANIERIIVVLGPGATEGSIPEALRRRSRRWDYVDFRGFALRRLLWPPAWEALDDQVCKLVAALLELPDAALPELREPERRRRNGALWAIAGGLTLVAAALGGVATWALLERARALEAEAQARRAEADARDHQDIAERHMHALATKRAAELCAAHPDDGLAFLQSTSQFPLAHMDPAWSLLTRRCSRRTRARPSPNRVDGLAWTRAGELYVHQLDGNAERLDVGGRPAPAGHFIAVRVAAGIDEVFALSIDGDVKRLGPVERLAYRAGPGARSFDVSADGRMLAVIDEDRVRALTLPELAVRLDVRVAPHPDARVVLSPDADRLVRFGGGAFEVWDLRTHRLEPIPGGLEASQIAAAAFAPDGALVLGGRLDGIAVVRRGSVDRLRFWPTIWSLATSPDGRHVAAGDEAGRVHVFDLRLGREEADWALSRRGVSALAYDARGDWLAASGGALNAGVTEFWRANEALSTQEITPSEPVEARLVGDRAALTWDFSARTVKRWGEEHLIVSNVLALARARRGAEAILLHDDGSLCSLGGAGMPTCAPPPVQSCHAVALDAAAEWIGCRQGDELQLWSTHAGKKGATFRGLTPNGQVAAIAPGGRYIAVVVPESHEILVHDAQAEGAPRRFPGSLVTFAQDGAALVLWREDASIDVHALAGGRDLHLEGHGPLLGMPLSPDGERLVTCLPDGNVVLTSLSSGHRLFLEHTPEHPRSAAFAGDTIVVGTQEGSVRIWDTRTGDERLHLSVASQAILWIDARADGALLVSTDEPAVRWWLPH